MNAKEKAKKERFVTINWDFLKNRLPILVTMLILIFKFVIDVSKQFDPQPLILIVLYILLLGSSIWAIFADRNEEDKIFKLKDKIKDLRNNNNKLTRANEELKYKFLKNNELLIKAHLREIIREVDLDHTCRISLYRYEESTKEFILIGRDSQNNLLIKPGRESYPEEIGIIGEAWIKGQDYEELSDFHQDQQGWLRDTMDLGFDERTASSLNMKSCTLFGFALNKPSRKVGIIIIESNKVKGFDQNNAKESLNKRQNELIELLDDIISDDFDFTYEAKLADRIGY